MATTWPIQGQTGMPGFNSNQPTAAEIQAAENAAQRSTNTTQLNLAQTQADNNIALADTLSRRGEKDAGLLARASEIQHAQKFTPEDSFMGRRLATQRKQLLQDSGQTTLGLNAPQTVSQPTSERAQIRKRRGQY